MECVFGINLNMQVRTVDNDSYSNNIVCEEELLYKVSFMEEKLVVSKKM